MKELLTDNFQQSSPGRKRLYSSVSCIPLETEAGSPLLDGSLTNEQVETHVVTVEDYVPGFSDESGADAGFTVSFD